MCRSPRRQPPRQLDGPGSAHPARDPAAAPGLADDGIDIKLAATGSTSTAVGRGCSSIVADLKAAWGVRGSRKSPVVRDAGIVADMLGPVSVTMLLAVVSSLLLGRSSSGASFFTSLIPFSAPAHAGTGTQIVHALGNAGVIVAGAAVATTAVVGLYACNCNLAVRVMMGSIYGLVLAAWLAYAVMEACHASGVVIDWITVMVLSLNFAAAGVVVLCFDAPVALGLNKALWLANGYTVLLASALAWLCSFMDDWTVLCTCVGIMLWDIVAVVTPCGPLRLALAIEKERKLVGDHQRLPRGLQYEGESYYLGSGDFVFYAVIVARGASKGVVAGAATIVAVMTGFAITSVMGCGRGSGHQSAVPALPVSVSFGVAALLLSWFVAQPYAAGTLP